MPQRTFEPIKNDNSNGSSGENSDGMYAGRREDLYLTLVADARPFLIFLAWVHIHPKETHGSAFGSSLLASGMISNDNSSTEWPVISDPFPYSYEWWSSQHHPHPHQTQAHHGIQAPVSLEVPGSLYTQIDPIPLRNTSESSPSTGHETQIVHDAPRQKQRKRRRPMSVHLEGDAVACINDQCEQSKKVRRGRLFLLCIDLFSVFVPTAEALSRAKNELSNCSWREFDLQAVNDFPCDSSHAFAMCPMGPEPKDFYGSPLRIGKFQARIIEPFSGSQRRNWTNLPAQDSIVYRPPSKNLYLVFTIFPLLGPQSSLEEGFALLTICRRRGVKSKWQPHSFIAFEDPDSRKKVMGHNIGFVANLDRCKETQTGRRVWGERTSHVNNANVDAKPVRMIPKGSAKNYNAEDQFCVIVSLHAPNGKLMSDVLGEICVTRTNPFQFQEKKVDQTLQHLLQELDKLTVSQRASLADSAHDRDMMQLLLTDANSTKEAAGLFSSALVDALPNTAVPLSHFYPPANVQISPNSPEIISRLKFVARRMGQLHANPDLVSKHSSYLKSGNVFAATGRFNQLSDSNLSEHRRWLLSESVNIDPQDVHDRAQNVGSLMAERKYKSKFIVCVANVYPDSIMVDKHDASVVYCLAEDGRESQLEIMDHVHPLARLAFTSKTARDEIEDVLIAPYMATYSENGGEERTFPYERFWLHLHAMHLDFFLYWTKFRNAEACRRIQARLLEEDNHFDPSLFGPADFKRFELRYSQDS